MKFHPEVLAAHAQFGGDLEDMQRRYDASEAIAVKALEWEVHPSDVGGTPRTYYGYWVGGYYHVSCEGARPWGVGTFDNKGRAQHIGFFDTLEAAKAAAQSDYTSRILSALSSTPVGEMGEQAHCCPICLKPFAPKDTCATDIELGTCHAECLEGAPTVNLETGEPVDGPIPKYRYDDKDSTPSVKSAFFAGFDAGEAAGKFGDDTADEAWGRYGQVARASPQGGR